MATNGSEPSTEVKAREMGWKPLDEFKGNPDHWRDADEYVQRGEEVLPIVRAENNKLRGELATVKAEAAEAKRLFTASQEAIAELKKYHTEDTQRQVEKAKRDLKAGIKEAKAEGNDDLEEKLREELTSLTIAAAASPPPAPPPLIPPKIDPAFISWRADNADWFEVDDNKTALMYAAAERIRKDPANNALVGRAFYNAAATEAERVLSGGKARTSKMEDGGGGRGSGGDGGPASKTFSDLPADAKAVCNRQSAKLVGEGRAFKTEAAWRKHYVEQFFLGEDA